MFNNPLVHFSRHCELAYWKSTTAAKGKKHKSQAVVSHKAEKKQHAYTS